MKRGIRFKIGLIMAVFLILIMTSVIVTFWTVDSQKSDGRTINLAGRQRMLTQKMTKEALAILEGRMKDDDVFKTIELFDNTLNALIAGDVQQGIPPVSEPRLLAQLNKVKEMWERFRENIEGLIRVAEEKRRIYDHIISTNTVLLERMNRIVDMMEKEGFNKRTINLAGRQRMLTQKMTKEALIIEYDRTIKDKLLSTVSLFDRTLTALMMGDSELGIQPPEDESIALKLRELEGEWKPFKRSILELVDAVDRIRGYTDHILANNVPLLKEMNVAVAMYEDISLSKVNRLKTIQMIFLFITFAVFGIGWLFLSRTVVNPLQRIAEVTRRVAEGDLTGEALSFNTSDEIGNLGVTVNSMKDNLKRMIGNIRETASHVVDISDTLAKRNTDFSQRITEQSSSVEETASTMEEISAGVRQNADTCREANKLSMDCRNKAEEGRKVMDNMMSSIEEINQSSQKISEIINVIEEIAFQTNLLALNAAVEAARAGEHGKGFAVVAVEVRNLAHRSAQAAKEITALIKENVTKADNGTKLAEMTRANLEEIIESVKRVTDLITEISAASQEQAGGVEQVNKAITQIDQVTQQNAVLMEETSTVSERLSEQANHLISLVGNFKISVGDGVDVHPTYRHEHMTEKAVDEAKSQPKQDSKGNGRDTSFQGDGKDEATDHNREGFVEM